MEPNTFFPETGQPNYYTLPVNGTWQTINNEWSVKPIKVIDDNRCPMLVVCEECGHATLELEIKQTLNSQSKTVLVKLTVLGLNRITLPGGKLKPTMLKPTFMANLLPSKRSTKGITLTLADLTPYPKKQFQDKLNTLTFSALLHAE